MATRMQPITPYNDSQGPSNKRKQSEAKVPIHTKMASVKRNGEPDPLKQALTAPSRVFDDTKHFASRKTQVTGHAYRPVWAKLTGKKA